MFQYIRVHWLDKRINGYNIIKCCEWPEVLTAWPRVPAPPLNSVWPWPRHVASLHHSFSEHSGGATAPVKVVTIQQTACVGQRLTRTRCCHHRVMRHGQLLRLHVQFYGFRDHMLIRRLYTCQITSTDEGCSQTYRKGLERYSQWSFWGGKVVGLFLILISIDLYLFCFSAMDMWCFCNSKK